MWGPKERAICNEYSFGRSLRAEFCAAGGTGCNGGRSAGRAGKAAQCYGSWKRLFGLADVATDYDKEEFGRIQAAAKRIRENSDVLIVIGIGGSYLGARACWNL